MHQFTTLVNTKVHHITKIFLDKMAPVHYNKSTPVVHLIGGELMTEATRRTVSLPGDVEEALIKLRKTDRFCKCSYSEIVRQLVVAGLATTREETSNHDQHSA